MHTGTSYYGTLDIVEVYLLYELLRSVVCAVCGKIDG